METTTTIKPTFDVNEIRKSFPILEREVNNQLMVYLDNAATSQKPQAVIDALNYYYSNYNANIHRGIHTLAEEATAAYEATRKTVKDFINAKSTDEIIFTRGTTEGVNLVAYTWGRKNISEGDEIIISGMEHHSNIVPWQILCEEKKAILKVIPISDEGELMMDDPIAIGYKKLLSSKTKLVSIVHVSNSLGTVNPVREIIDEAHKVGALVFVDGAQSTVHLDIDVQEMDCDFFAFSGHKVYGPTGVGVLYGKKKILEEMPVFMGGGEMIKEVTFEKTTFSELPYKYEAGTPNIADTIALKVALDFVTETKKDIIRNHENALLKYATEQISAIDGLRIIGTAKNKVSVISFVIKNIHPQDIGVLLDNQGIAVRTGHHCTQPLMARFGVPGTVRASFAMYNTKEEVDRLVVAIKKAIKMLT
ncbi:MAG: cysteine desulfurase [Bacteroidota bacterium]|nr:cysteine desulfurase [Bacteroidota bacterium]